jgi:hypothetical protein
MAVPPRGDPQRPLHLAIRSIRVLALLFLLVASCGFGSILAAGRRMPFIVGGAILVFYFLPGIAYVFFAIYMKQRKFWAVVAALVLASLQCFVALIALAMSIVLTFHAGGDPSAIIGLVTTAFVFAALAQLVYHLAKSFESIKYVPIEMQRGFEALPVQPIVPAETSPTGENDGSSIQG